MDIKIETDRLRSLWEATWERLPKECQAELTTAVLAVLEVPQSLQGRNSYGSYSPANARRAGVVSLYAQDLQTLSDDAITAVMAHELGHAYCHLKLNNPSPCPPEIDTGADYTASAWGFQKELRAFHSERKPATGGS